MDGDQDLSQQEKLTEDRGAISETTDNPAKSDTKRKQQEENVSQTKSENTNAAKSREFEENGDMHGIDKSEQKSKDDAESPIRLTLEEDDNFHVDEVQFL